MQPPTLYIGISESNLAMLQRAQNSLARIVTSARKYKHMTLVLNQLHWAVLTYKSISQNTFVLLTNHVPSRQCRSSYLPFCHNQLSIQCSPAAFSVSCFSHLEQSTTHHLNITISERFPTTTGNFSVF